MKVLLIFLFILLAGYLVIHMCGGFTGRGKKVSRSKDDFEKSIIVLDNLPLLKDRELSRLRGDIQGLKELLDTHPTRQADESTTVENRSRPVSTAPKLSSRELLNKIRRETRPEIVQAGADRRRSDFIPRIIVINLILLLITVLVILL